MASDQLTAAIWGFGGALVYAAPKLSACLFAPHEPGDGPARCVSEFVITLVIGSFAAAAFAPWSEQLLGLKHDGQAVAALIGLVANPTAPKLTDALSALITNVLSGKLAEMIKKVDPK